MSRVPRPRDFIEVEALDERIERQWAALEAAGLPAPRAGLFARRRVLVLALLACAGAGALVAVGLSPRVLSPRSGAIVESAEREVRVKLEDGSQLELAEKTQLMLLRNEPNAIELSLRTGRAHFEVSHRRGRAFTVDAGACQVRVVGTRFSLEQEPRGAGSFVRIEVEEGVVEVRRRDVAGGELHRLRRGESWSATLEPGVKPESANAAETRAPSAADASDASKKPLPSATPEANVVPAAAPVPSAPRERRAARTSERAARALPSHAQPVAEPELPAAELFQRATLSRRAGRMRDAANDYETLLERFPNDARAGLSAFELGRIRMDALGDPEGAINALSRAAAGRAQTSFHEDALARIVSANDALGRHDSCVRARERYLSSYPHGVHARTLSCR